MSPDLKMSTDLEFYTAAEVADLLRLNHQVVLRKLQAGEIPAYRIGRDWRVERTQLMDWLESRSNRRNRDVPPQERKVLDAYLGADGRLREIPPKRSNREIVLRRLAREFEPARVYPESEVNELLRRFHDDVAWLRRELVASKHLVRTRGLYKRASS